ncbi:MAG TPA: two-component sensor histidine kinase [Sphingobacteriaceae bacterium]|nr:two-component sensor histidine kinase [Sphingobacteriaceae bacterium]
MRLSAYYNKASIIITISILLAGAVIYFFAINYIVKNRLDHHLAEEIEEVEFFVKVNKKLPAPIDVDEIQTTFLKINPVKFERRIFDTVYTLNGREKRYGRAIAGPVFLDGSQVIVTIIISKENTEYLVKMIAIITLALMMTLLIILFLTNKFILRGVWKPFYSLLHQIKAFNISQSTGFHLTSNKIEEFEELNEAVHAMSLRVKNDFQHLKYFTENASHEMMTPLAVITAKLDTLIQDESLRPRQYDQINDIYTATSKLSRLNQSLLLLVKIENNLIEQSELIRLDTLIVEKLREFQELIISKGITVREHLAEKEVEASKYLLDILLNNFLSNAIKHSINDSELIITLTNDSLSFQNRGLASLDGARLFERFHKGGKSEGTGLGLTITKNICVIYGWDLSYSYEKSLHNFRIRF